MAKQGSSNALKEMYVLSGWQADWWAVMQLSEHLGVGHCWQAAAVLDKYIFLYLSMVHILNLHFLLAVLKPSLIAIIQFIKSLKDLSKMKKIF